MNAIQMLEADLRTELAASRAILDAADVEGRELSATEQEQADKHMQAIAALKSRIAGEKNKELFREKVENFDKMVAGELTNPVPADTQATVAKGMTLGDALTNSDYWKALQAKFKSQDGQPGHFQTPKISVSHAAVNRSLRMKAAGDPVLESDNAAIFAGGPGPLTTFFGLETPGFVQYRLTVEDLLTTVPITVGNSATYPIVMTRTQASGTPQTEGQAKAGTEYEFDMVTEVLLTIAAYVKMSTQFIEDAPGLVAYINADLPLQVRQNVEAYLTSGLYDAANGAGGGGTADGATISGTNGWDAILEAATVIQENGGDPTAFLITPNDWAALRASKDGEDRYLAAGPFAATGDPWALRPVVTTSATDGSPLVGDFNRGAKIYSRGGYQVDSTNSDQDDFIKNKFTVRAERRLVLGVTYPEFFVEAHTGTS